MLHECLNYWVLINIFWICLRYVRYRFVRYRFVRYRFRFVRYSIPRGHFVCLQDVFKTSSKHVFKTYFQDVFSITIFSLPGCLEDVLRDVFDRRHGVFASHLQLMSWKAKNCYTEDVLKTSSIHVLSPL